MKNLVTLLLISLSVLALRLNETFEKTYKASLNIIKSKSFKFDSYMVVNDFQRSKNSSSLNFNSNKISGVLSQSLNSKLPDQIEFKNDPIDDFNFKTVEDRFQIETTFSIIKEGDVYKFNIKTMPNGKSFIIMVRNQKESIEFIGYLKQY